MRAGLQTILALATIGAIGATAAAGCGPLTVWRGRSPDRRSEVLVLEQDERQRVVVDGVSQPAFEAVGFTHLRFDGQDLVYPARRGERWHVVANGRTGAAHRAIGQLAVAAGRIAYAALDEEGWRVVVDGRRGPVFDSIVAGSLRLSEDGRRVAYVAREGGGERAVIDDEVGPRFDRLQGLRLGAKGLLVGYVGWDAEGARVVTSPAGGVARAGRPHDEVWELILARDEPRWAALAADGERPLLLRDDGASSAPAGSRELRLSPDGEHVAFLAPGAAGDGTAAEGAAGEGAAGEGAAGEGAAGEGAAGEGAAGEGAAGEGAAGEGAAGAAGANENEQGADGEAAADHGADAEATDVWLDGARVGSADQVRLLRLRADGRGVCYVARREEAERVVCDGEVGPRLRRVDALLLTDSGHWGYVASRGVGRVVVVDGRAVHRGEWAGALALAARGEGWAFLIRHAGRRYVVTPRGRVEIPRPFADTLVLSADGAHWALAVAEPRERRLRVWVDGVPRARLDLEEVAAAMQQGREPVEIVRAIVAGELTRFTATAPARSGRSAPGAAAGAR